MCGDVDKVGVSEVRVRVSGVCIMVGAGILRNADCGMQKVV